MSQNIFIIGACSAIAKAVARQYAAKGAAFCLFARDADKLQMLADDLLARGASAASCITGDASRCERHADYIQQALQVLPRIDICLIAHGTLPDQAECETSQPKTLSEIATNGTSVVSLMNLLSTQLLAQKQGTLAVISSVAGDRGRASNYTYGAAKALVSTFAEGMIARFASTPVHVLLIKPGFVDTPMTAAFDKKGPLWAQPEDVAARIVKAIDNKKDIIYVPAFWWLIMQVIKHIPTAIFKKLSL